MSPQVRSVTHLIFMRHKNRRKQAQSALLSKRSCGQDLLFCFVAYKGKLGKFSTAEDFCEVDVLRFAVFL